MRALVTGAGGFIGSMLARRLAAAGSIGARRIDALALLDRRLPAASDPIQTMIEGDLREPAMLDRIAAFRPDVVFHLAAVPGGAAEADYRLGRRVNLDATLALFETLAELPRSGDAKPVVVYASTVAVYGLDLPSVVTPATPLRPAISYGAHKLACEILLADLSRRGRLDGRSLRLPGIVARPRGDAGLTSAFMSDALHALAAGEPYTCPVGPQATSWWMSAARCADNLIHAAGMPVDGADPARAWPMPVLRLSMAEIVEAAARRYGDDRRTLLRYAPDARVEAVFGRYPTLDDHVARAFGLRDDGSADALIARALQSNDNDRGDFR